MFFIFYFILFYFLFENRKFLYILSPELFEKPQNEVDFPCSGMSFGTVCFIVMSINFHILSVFSIAPDKKYPYKFFSYFSAKTYVVGTHQKRLGKALLMSTHNISFRGEIRKISIIFS